VQLQTYFTPHSKLIRTAIPDKNGCAELGCRETRVANLTFTYSFGNNKVAAAAAELLLRKKKEEEREAVSILKTGRNPKPTVKQRFVSAVFIFPRLHASLFIIKLLKIGKVLTREVFKMHAKMVVIE
jgi:hypothetical protein